MSLKKTAKLDSAYATYVNDRAGFTWKVLKVYQTAKNEASNQYARWLVAAKSPMTYDSWEYGDTYVNDVVKYGRLESASEEFKQHLAAKQ